MFEQKYKRIEYEDRQIGKRLMSNMVLIIALSVLTFGAFLMATTFSASNAPETTFDSLRGSENGVGVSSLKDTKSTLESPTESELDNIFSYSESENNYIAQAVNGAKDEIEYTGMELTSRVEEDLMKDMEKVEITMMESLEDVTKQVSGSKVSKEVIESVQNEAVDRLEEKMIDKIDSIAKEATENGKENIDKVVKDDKEKGKENAPVVGIVDDVDLKEWEAENIIAKVVEGESIELIDNLGQEAKDIAKGVIEDLLDVEMSDSDISNAFNKAKIDDKSKNIDAISDEITDAKAVIEAVEEEELAGTEEELSFKIFDVVKEKLFGSKASKEDEERIVEELEEKEFLKLESAADKVEKLAESNIDMIAEKYEELGKNTKEILDEVQEEEWKSENKIVDAIENKTQEIIKSLDEDFQEVTKDEKGN